ncbi:MAG: hypothetical protein HOI70_04625 [Opitutae bacterium]|nr:hypothetical protein [Opitutae bacterium]
MSNSIQGSKDLLGQAVLDFSVSLFKITESAKVVQFLVGKSLRLAFNFY